MFSRRKNHSYLPVHARCRNCGVSLYARYCHVCGQDVFAGSRRSVKDILLNMLENIFAFDNKILITLFNLIFLPGKLTKEFINGRVTSYVVPAKLFWFISIMFFILLANRLNFGDDNLVRQAPAEISVKTAIAGNTALTDTLSMTTNPTVFQAKKHKTGKNDGMEA